LLPNRTEEEALVKVERYAADAARAAVVDSVAAAEAAYPTPPAE